MCRKLGETCPIHGIFVASSGMDVASFQGSGRLPDASGWR
jgi:hypothetical protein